MTVLAVIGAKENPSASGWYTTTSHEVIFAISEVSTTKIRFMQDDGGGGTSPNIAWLNELEAYEKVSGDQIDYTYDSNGNLTQRYQTKTGDDIDEDYEYDYANRLDVYKKTISTLQTHYTYEWTPLGQRFSKEDELNPTENPEQRFIYDGFGVVSDYTYDSGGSSWDHINSYVAFPGGGAKIARIFNDEVLPEVFITRNLYYVRDAQGTHHKMLEATGLSVFDKRSADPKEKERIDNMLGELIKELKNLEDRFGFNGFRATDGFLWSVPSVRVLGCSDLPPFVSPFRLLVSIVFPRLGRSL